MDKFTIQQIDDRFGDGWHKYIMDTFVVQMIANQYRDRWQKWYHVKVN